MYPRYAQKVPCRYRSASAQLYGRLPCESWAGRAGLHGRYGMVSRLAALHSRIRAPQRNLVSSSKALLLLACAGSAWMRVERIIGSVYALLAHPGLLCMHGRGASLGSIALLHTHQACISQQHRISANLLARRDASPNLLCPYLIISPPHCCYNLLLVLFFPLLLLLLAFLAATVLCACSLASCCWVESIPAPQTLLGHRTSHIASAHLQAHLRHLPRSSSALGLLHHHSCPPSTLFLVVAAAPSRLLPTTSPIGLPALTCCARLDHSSTSRLSSYYYASRPTRRLSSVTQQPSLPLTFCIFL